jgi:hypothetical protein
MGSQDDGIRLMEQGAFRKKIRKQLGKKLRSSSAQRCYQNGGFLDQLGLGSALSLKKGHFGR